MKRPSSLKLQLAMAIAMFLISVFMTISYYFDILNDDAGNLKITAFYVWIFSVFAWLIKVFYDIKKINKMNKDHILND